MYRVGVIRGGPSVEHDVSLHTGASVLGALRDSEFQPVDIVVTKNKDWLSEGRTWDPVHLLQTVDVVFNALHGAYGEDGTLQRYFDTHGIQYTGSGAFPSSVAMNKALTKTHVQTASARLAPHLMIGNEQADDLTATLATVQEMFNGPYVLKPVNCGSSVDVHIVDTVAESMPILKELLRQYPHVLIEQKVFGTEATVGVINNFREAKTYTLPPVEINPEQDFFTYEAKYNGQTENTCPGRFSSEIKANLMQAASEVHELLGLSQYSRSDFIVAPEGVYFLEVNSLPDLSQTALMPKALDAVGVSYNAFIKHLLYDALRHTPHTQVA